MEKTQYCFDDLYLKNTTLQFFKKNEKIKSLIKNRFSLESISAPDIGARFRILKSREDFKL